MSKPKQDAAHITAGRATRLYRLLTLLEAGPCRRATLLRRLRVDLRGYYRDLELLRSLGIAVGVEGTKYQLLDPLEAALARLPFPDPKLNFRDALVLSRGTTAAHRRFRRRVEACLAPAGRDRPGNGSPRRGPDEW
jgi:predicted DNA-binding transcriptional regulator YafY